MMNTKHVLVTIPVEEAHVKQLQDAAPQWEFRFRGGDNLIYAPRERAVQCSPLSQEDVDWANVLLGNVPPAMLSGSPALEWVQTGSALTRCSPTLPGPMVWPLPSICWACC